MVAYEKHWSSPFLKNAGSLIDKWAPFLLIALAFLAILPGLGQSSLLDWDEAIYAQVAREILQSGDWINLYHGYQPYFEKPPLLMWAIALSYKCFGINEFTARMPSATAGILLVIVSFLLGTNLYGKKTGLFAGLILISSFGYVFQSRNGTTNIPLSMFIYLGIYAYLRLQAGRQTWWYLIYTCFALAFMTKFWAALLLPAAIFLAIAVEGKIAETLRTKHFWLGLLLAAIIIIPWHLLVYLHSGQIFVDIYLSRNLIDRTLTPLEGHAGSTVYYLEVLRNYISPWFFLIPFALALTTKEIMDKDRKSAVLLILILLTVGLHTFVINTKLEVYILPIFPALAILIARLFVLDTSSDRSNSFVYVVIAGLIVTLVAQNKILILAILAGLALIPLLKTQILSKQQAHQVIAGLIFVGFAMIGTINYIQGNNRLSIWPIYANPDQPISQIAALAAKNNPSRDEPLLGFEPQQKDRLPHSAVEGPAATFYSNRPVLVAETWEQFVKLMQDQGSGEMLVAENYLELIPAEFNVEVVEKVYPLVYATFSQ